MSGPCEFLPWDSDFFGKRIARVTTNRLTPDVGRAVSAWAGANRIDCVYFLADLADPVTLRVAAREGFDLVDVRVTLEWQPAIPAPPVGVAPPVRPAIAADVEALKRIARESHRDSRFYADGRFDPARCDELFAVWIEKSCAGFADVVFVAEVDGRLAGYITGRSAGERDGEIGLVAVAKTAQGCGCGRALAASVLSWFANRNATRVRVVTQGRNSAALAFYQRNGFRVASIGLWFHRWPTAGCP